MPLLTKDSFPFQVKSNFRVISEFLNISVLPNQYVWKRFIFSNKHLIFATIRINKIVIFLKKTKTFSLFNIIRNDSSQINTLNLSFSGSKLSFFIKQKTILVFRLTIKPYESLKNAKNFSLSKVLEFCSETEKQVFLLSSCFNNDENRVYLSFSNGKILLLNFIGKIFSIFKTENPIFILHPGIGIKSNLEFYGILNKKILINYNIIDKKHKNFKKSRIYIIKANFVISFQKNKIEISCNCHGKTIKTIIFSGIIKKALLIEHNKILIWQNESFVYLNIGCFFFKFTKTYYFEALTFCGKLFKFKNQFHKNLQGGTFFILVLSSLNNYLEFKPLTEKIKFLAHSSTLVFKNNKINGVKFFGRKNSIIVVNNSNRINIFNGNCFKFIGVFVNKNIISTEIIIKGKLLLVNSNFNEFFFIDLPYLILLEKNFSSRKISIDFSISEEKNPKCFLLSGLENGILKFWSFLFYSYNKTYLKLLWVKKIVEDEIISVSMSTESRIIASLSKKKGIFLMNFEGKHLNNGFGLTEKKISCIKFCPKSKLLCAGTDYGSIIFFNILDNSYSKIIKGDGASLLTINFNFNGTVLIAGFYDGTIKIISIFNSSSFTVYGNHKKPVWSCGFSQDEQIVAGCFGGQLIILKDISFENAKLQKKKISRIFSLKKSLGISKIAQSFEFVFYKLVFVKNSFMFIDFLEFSFRRNPVTILKIFSGIIKKLHIDKLDFILKSLVINSLIRKKNFFLYKLVLTIFENLNCDMILNINFSILKGAFKLFQNWIRGIKYLEKLNY
jgi:hypothetical protein